MLSGSIPAVVTPFDADGAVAVPQGGGRDPGGE